MPGWLAVDIPVDTAYFLIYLKGTSRIVSMSAIYQLLCSTPGSDVLTGRTPLFTGLSHPVKSIIVARYTYNLDACNRNFAQK